MLSNQNEKIIMTWKLKAITAELGENEISIDRDMLVGRHQDADILLQSAEISRRHAAFLIKDDALWVQDLKSSNGTFVNDIRVDDQKLLKDNDVVQFASIKFHVYASEAQPQQAEKVSEPVESPAVQQKETVIVQPAEAIATSEIEKTIDVVKEKTPAQQLSEQGMPELSARDAGVQLTRDGMPTSVGVPKPAPIPQGIDIHAQPEPAPVAIPETQSVADQQTEEKKNASVGLFTIITLVILAVIAWLFFK